MESPEGSEDCTPLHEFTTITPGVLTVAAINQAPALYSEGPDAPWKGVDAVLIPKFAEENCLTVVFKPLTGSAATLDLTAGNSDMMGGLVSKSPERGEQFNQTEGTIFYFPLVMVSRAEDTYDSFDALEGKTVGIQAGSDAVAPLEALFGADHVIQYQSADAVYQALLTGRIDATPQGLSGLWQATSQHPGELGYEFIAPDPDHPELTAINEADWPHTKGNDAMTAAIDDFYSRSLENGLIAEALKTEAGIDDPSTLLIAP